MKNVLSRGGGQLETHVDILVQVCNAVAFAHRRGVLHRDIKPSNILIGEFGEVYVADWGVATRKLLPGETPRKPQLIGTPCYLAPEMVAGDDTRMDERSDVFLLGATLYEVLSGRPPWGGKDLRETVTEAWLGQPAALPADAPAELAAVCQKAMSVNPTDRYQTALQLRDALGGFLRHRGSVKLAEAAQERLTTLTAMLDSGQVDRAKLYPLVSECRFGFSQALIEWQANQPAREGLRASLIAAARYEVSQGNLAAVRALLAELDLVPEALRADLERLEQASAAREAREQRLKHLARELDPTVSLRQRGLMLIFLALTVVALVALRWSPWGQAGDPRYTPAVLVAGSLIYALAIFLGRRSLLATRVNRRIAGLVGMGILGMTVNRVLGYLQGAPTVHTMVGDMVLMAAVSSVGGFTLHSGFFVAAGAFLLTATAGVIWPAQVVLFFGLGCLTTLVVLGSVFRRWRSELWLGKDER